MNDFISRQTLLDRFRESCNGECGCCEYNDSGFDTGENCRLIVETPAADVQPVKRGVWKKHTVCENRNNGTTHIYEYSEDYMTCSNCWHSFNYCDNDTERFNYCPNCGALMQDE